MAKELLVAWLNDAYAMEQAQAKMLEQFMKDFDQHTDIQEKLKQHLEETKTQAEKVKTCIEGLGEEVSQAKSALGTMLGAVQGISTGPYKDETVKNMVMIHASEHYEHACYLAIATAAKSLGKEDVATLSMSIAQEKEDMAEWAQQQLPKVVDAVVSEQKGKE